MSADVAAGSPVTFEWDYVRNKKKSSIFIFPRSLQTSYSQWPAGELVPICFYNTAISHQLLLEDHQGPVSTYMASCDGDCTSFSASNAKWFKLDAGGYDPDTKQWAADLLRAS
jgi:hypothetical protein